MDTLLEALREACGPALWSQGVRLAREGSVRREGEDGEAIRARVVARGGLLSPLVTLYPDDPDWSCECGRPEDACEHAAAVAIAWSRGELRDSLDASAGGEEDDGAAPIGYRLAFSEAGVEVSRVVLGVGGERPLEGRLASIARGRAEGPSFVASPADLEVETLLAGRGRAPLPRALLPRLYAALAGAREVRAEGRVVETSGEPLLPCLELLRRPEGFILRARAPAGVERVLPGGSALVRGVLRPVGDPGLTAREREELAAGRLYPHVESGRLFGEILPRLARRLPLAEGAPGMPALDRGARARLSLGLELESGALVAHPEIVYGTPPIARVRGGRLEPLGERVPERDAALESRLERELSSRLGLVVGERVRLEADAALRVLEGLETWRPGEVPASIREAFRVAGGLEAVAPASSGDANLPLDFAPEGSAGESGARASAEGVLAAWESGAQHVRLSDESWGRIPADWLERHAPLLRDLLAARDAAGRLPPCVAADEARLARLVGARLAPSRAALAERLARAVEDEGDHSELPAGLATRLRDYQLDGVRWMARLVRSGLGALLADDMGLGKTVQAAALLGPSSLVACPTSVLHNWVDELTRFRPDLSVTLFHGGARELDDADVVVTSHALVRLDAEALAARRWNLVVFDESQALRNPDSQLAQAACALEADARIGLSGTPVENRLLELWSQMRFLNPGLLGSRGHFDEHYARPVAEGDEEAAARLRRRIGPFVLRRLKSEVAPELPTRTEIVLRCRLEPHERAVYDALRAATRSEILARLREGAGVMEALEALLRLRQAACHSALVPGGSADSSSKIDLLLERVDEVAAEGRKALVFSQWTSLLDLVEPGLVRRGIAFERLDGSTRDRAGVVSRFQDEDARASVLLVSLKAGGAGLNLTAADHVFLVDPWWNPASEDQAADRTHRIGQTRPVFVYRLIAENTVEERILALQREKRRLASAALSGATGGAGLDRADILHLLDDEQEGSASTTQKR